MNLQNIFKNFNLRQQNSIRHQEPVFFTIDDIQLKKLGDRILRLIKRCQNHAQTKKKKQQQQQHIENLPKLYQTYKLFVKAFSKIGQIMQENNERYKLATDQEILKAQQYISLMQKNLYQMGQILSLEADSGQIIDAIQDYSIIEHNQDNRYHETVEQQQEEDEEEEEQKQKQMAEVEEIDVRPDRQYGIEDIIYNLQFDIQLTEEHISYIAPEKQQAYIVSASYQVDQITPIKMTNINIDQYKLANLRVPNYFQKDCPRKFIHCFAEGPANLIYYNLDNIQSLLTIDQLQKQEMMLDFQYQVKKDSRSCITPSGEVFLIAARQTEDDLDDSLYQIDFLTS